MTDAHTWMLDLSITLSDAGPPFTAVEQDLYCIALLDVHLAPNGFDGWLAYSSCERLAATGSALATVGCGDVGDLVAEALRRSGIDPLSMSDADKDAAVESSPSFDDLDDRFYDLVEDCMTRAYDWARTHAGDIRPIPPA